MKRELRIPALAVIAIAVFLSFGLVATGSTYYVPGGAPAGSLGTITEALAAADPGDTIVVTDTYDPTDEKFPILVQKDNITIRAEGTVEIIMDEESKAVFVVGAHRVYNPYTHEYDVVRVSGVTIQGFTITATDDNEDGDFIDGGDIVPDIGIVVKEADNVTLTGNTIIGTLEGIRLLDATGCLVTGNTIQKIGPYNLGGVEHYQGIGLFLENATGNTLTCNTVTLCGLGLFVFESNGNTISSSTFSNNEKGGIVLNDSNDNTLTALSVSSNDGWGVRFVFADTNVFNNSWVEGNEYGGVELVGSQLNTIEKNVVFSNGTLGQDAPQIVVAPGDKALLTNAVFDGMEDPESEYAHPFFDFREEKELVEAKLELLELWLWDLDYELEELIQKTAAAWGMAEQGVQTSSLVAQIDRIIFEKRAIEKGKIYGTLEDPTNDPGGNDPVEFTPGSKMDDPVYNPTLEDSTHALVDDLDWYTKNDTTYGGTDFNLDRDGTKEDPRDTEDDELCWSKLNILEIIGIAIRNEILFDTDGADGAYVDLNDSGTIGDFAGEDEYDEIDSLKEKIWDYYYRELILESDKTALLLKLDAILGYLEQARVIIDDIVGELISANEALDVARADALDGMPYDIAKAELLKAKGDFEDAIELKLGIYGIIGSIWHKLCLVNLELPPETRVNSKLVGKKEKPWKDITEEDLYGYNPKNPPPDHVNGLVDDVVDELNADPLALAILASVDPDRVPMMFTPDDIDVDNRDLRHSIKNMIVSNVITSDLDNISGENIGIVLASSFNTVVNNLITNEAIGPLDEETRYEEVHRLDVGILLLSNENLIAYNAIEFVNTGMIRGGDWEWDDYQLEYVFEKLARVAYWPGPGFEIQGCGLPIPEEIESRPTDFVSVLRVHAEDVSVNLYDIVVKRNRIALNFFEWNGVGIQIEYAESNVIDENLFYECANAGIMFGRGSMPNIKLEENDYYGGHSVDNNGTLAVDASKDYTPPEGQPGHAPAMGNVIDPAATAPFCYDNFGTITKFTELKQWLSDRGITFDMEVFFNEGLPPNLNLFAYTVVLPPEKPRVCGDIFGEAPPQPGTVCCDLESGWNLISLPVEPANPDPEAVFDEITGTLYLYSYNAGAGWDTVENGQLTAVSALGGYWLWVGDDPEFCVSGTALTGPQAIGLDTSGWQTIGVPYAVAWGTGSGGSISITRGTQTKTLAEAVAAGWIYSTVWEYDAAAEVWIKPTVATGATLVPCKGYWIYTYVDDLVLGYSETQGPPGPPPVPSSMPMGLKAPTSPPVPGIPVSFSPDGLLFGCYPNPVTDVHTTTFAVKGAMAAFVDAIKVQIFDLSGRKVYEYEEAGTSTDWHTDNDYGEYLANGVYLYKLYALVEGQWVVSEVKKLAILR